MKQSPVLVSKTAVEIVSLSLAKTHCAVDGNHHDALIQSYINSAIAMIEGYEGMTGQVIQSQKWEQSMSSFYEDIDLPVWPVDTVESVKYYNLSNVETTLSNSVYSLLREPDVHKIVLNKNQSWPSTYDRLDAVKVTWNSGTTDTAKVDDKIKQAVLLTVAHWYKNREASIEGVMMKLPIGAETLINMSSFRRF